LKTVKVKFWIWRLRVLILLAFLVAFFKQLSGINAILYFAPRIFEMPGLGAKTALLQSVDIGVTNLISKFVGLGLPWSWWFQLMALAPRACHPADLPLAIRNLGNRLTAFLQLVVPALPAMRFFTGPAFWT
jgi:Sugar (and other) transporter